MIKNGEKLKKISSVWFHESGGKCFQREPSFKWWEGEEMCFQSLAVTHNKSLINFMQKYFALSPPHRLSVQLQRGERLEMRTGPSFT
jgi:hypothetical protein